MNIFNFEKKRKYASKIAKISGKTWKTYESNSKNTELFCSHRKCIRIEIHMLIKTTRSDWYSDQGYPKKAQTDLFYTNFTQNSF